MRDNYCPCPRCTGRDDGMPVNNADPLGVTWTDAFEDDFPLEEEEETQKQKFAY